METFKIITPSTILAPYVKYYWLLETDNLLQAQERVIPIGSVQLIFHRESLMYSATESGLQPRSFIGGQSFSYSDLILTGKVSMIVVVFHPYGARPFFNIPLDKVFDMNVSVRDMDDTSLKELEDKLMYIRDENESIRLIEDYLVSRLYGFDTLNYNRIYAAIKFADGNEVNAISLMAQNSCLSEKQFHRIFSEYVGINPKKFLRILRFQRALHMLQTTPQINLTWLAAECGFYDQPHLIKEFKALSGYTPTEYLAVCAPYSDYFSTL